MDKDQINRIEEKLDGIGKDITDIKVTSAVQTEQLKEHMKRSDQLEAHLEYLRTEEVEPIKSKIQKVEGALKLLTIAGLILSVLVSIQKLFF